ncbi:MAG TPA: phosphotransferase, partial [Solirubrobacteraceae bacterium]|nr:phosphotransferase [Solirubrobacteraceae bacterium]
MPSATRAGEPVPFEVVPGDSRSEVGPTLAAPVPQALGLIDQLGLWGNLGVSLLGFTGAIFVLQPGGAGTPRLSILAAICAILAAICAIVAGTILGTVPIALAGLPGTVTGAPAMVPLRGIFGAELSHLPTVLNVVRAVLGAWPAETARRIAGLPRAWTHGDWHPSNLTWSQAGEPVAVLDLGLANRTTPARDVAIAIERSCVSRLAPAPRADLDAVGALLEGHTRVRALAPAERAAPPRRSAPGWPPSRRPPMSSSRSRRSSTTPACSAHPSARRSPAATISSPTRRGSPACRARPCSTAWPLPAPAEPVRAGRVPGSWRPGAVR